MGYGTHYLHIPLNAPNGEKFSDRYSSTQNVLEFFFFLVRTCFSQPTDPNASGTVAEN